MARANVVDLRKLSPTIKTQFEKVAEYRKTEPEIPIKDHCRRVGLSVSCWYKINKSLAAAACRSLASYEARVQNLNIAL
jgi:hypothetical protein